MFSCLFQTAARAAADPAAHVSVFVVHRHERRDDLLGHARLQGPPRETPGGVRHARQHGEHSHTQRVMHVCMLSTS